LAEFYALAIQRMRAEEALQQAHDTLERRVDERTQELVQANEQLSLEIEERKQTEEELLQAKSTLQSVFDGISDPLVMMDNTLSVTILNEAAKKFYQVSDHEDIVGKICYEAMKEGQNPVKGVRSLGQSQVAKVKDSSEKASWTLRDWNMLSCTPLRESPEMEPMLFYISGTSRSESCLRNNLYKAKNWPPSAFWFLVLRTRSTTPTALSCSTLRS
jgi:transcriptional regulator with PAS, ATPase and Fis domain